MWLRYTRVVTNGRYKRKSRPDRGILIYRPVEGIAIRADMLRRTERWEVIFYSIWLAVNILVVILTREIILLIFLFVGVHGLMGTFFASLRVRKDCPIVEIYEKGVNDVSLSWPWEFNYFWPFDEIRETVITDSTILLKAERITSVLIIYLEVLGPRGVELIKMGRDSPENIVTIEEAT